MLIAELKDRLKAYDKADLQLILVELYKAVPKKVCEEKQIDDLIALGPAAYKRRKEVPGGLVKVDLKPLQEMITCFIDNAYKQNYLAPNRFVSKNDRPKWRFVVRDFFKTLQTIPADSDDGRTATELMAKLYEMLCYACDYYLFRSEDPFRSVGIVQGETLDLIASRLLLGGTSPERIRRLIELVVEGRVDRESLPEVMVSLVIERLKTPDLRVIAIEQAELLLAAHRQRGKQKKSFDPTIEYHWQEKNNLIVRFIFFVLMRQSEYDQAIQYYHQHFIERNKEVALYILLNSLEVPDRQRYWIREYDQAVQKGIQPRQNLQKVRSFLQEHDRFPDSDEREVLIFGRRISGETD
jgi:hypothetical protein